MTTRRSVLISGGLITSAAIGGLSVTNRLSAIDAAAAQTDDSTK